MIKTILFLSLCKLTLSFLNTSLYIQTNTIIDFNNLITTSEFLNAVVYYDSSRECNEECLSADQILLKLAEEFDGIIQFCKSDCSALKQQAQLEDFPICNYPDKLPILIFYKPPEHKYDQQTHEKQFPEEIYYGIPTNFVSLTEFTKKLIPNYTILISNQKEFEDFLDYYDLPHKVILFTDARETSIMFKGLSIQFKDRIDFGEIRVLKNEQKKIAEEYQIDKYPSLIIVEVGPNKKIKEIHKFQEKSNFANAFSFIKQFARTNKITRTIDQIKDYYPLIEKISASNFSDIILENSNNINFVHFSINNEQHYAWKELITKLSNIFEYFEMNCTIPENLAFIESFSKQNEKDFPLIGLFQYDSEYKQKYFLNFEKPDDIFNNLAIYINNKTEEFGTKNAKEFMKSLIIFYQSLNIQKL